MRAFAAGPVLALLLAAQATPALAAPLVKSKDGRLAATPSPETNWCGPAVNIRIESPSGKLPRDEEFIVRFLTGTKAAVLSECPAAYFLRVDHVDGGRIVDYSYAFRETDWNFVQVPGVTSASRGGIIATLSPLNLRAVAKTEAILLTAGVNRPTAFLNDGPGVVGPVQWEVDRIALSLSVDPVDTTNPNAMADVLAGVARSMKRICPNPNAPLSTPEKTNTGQFTMACKSRDTSFFSGAMVYSLGSLTAVLRLASLNGNPAEDQRLNELMAAFDDRFRAAQ